MSSDERERRRIKQALFLLPLLIAFLVIGGAFLGFLVSAIMGYGGLVFPLLFSTAGFALSIWLSILIAEALTGERTKRKK